MMPKNVYQQRTNYDSHLAIAYMTHLIQVRDEDMLEVAVFMDTLPDFDGMTTLMDESGFELLCKCFARKHPEAYKTAKNGRLPKSLTNVIEQEWYDWQESRRGRQQQYSYEDEDDESVYSFSDRGRSNYAGSVSSALSGGYQRRR